MIAKEIRRSNRKCFKCCYYMLRFTQYLPNEKDEYIDDDGILEEVLRQEREARQRRRQNHYRNPNGVTVRLCLTNFVNN